MKMQHHLELNPLTRSTSTASTSSTTKMLQPSSTFNPPQMAIVPNPPSATSSHKSHSLSNRASSLLHSLFQFLFHRRNSLSLTRTLGLTLRRKLTGTLFGHRHGHVTFSLQLDPRAQPLSLLHLDISTTALLKEMSSGLLRIALEAHKLPGRAQPSKLLKQPKWTMYCNGRETGLALSRTCEPYDRHVLNTIRTVSVGAGVIPVLHDGSKGGACSELGELVYMRAEFERVVGSSDSEALFMINPDGNCGSELSIFLLRI
ncbi:Protein MIZU-KUSSEI 1, partial [Cucurbita argyrosperma subsp. argyrosperma]